MTRYGMVIDLKRCVGCDTCTLACKAMNATSRGVVWNRVLKYETGKYPESRLHFLPITCMHCQEPACVEVCPTGATTKRPDGIVIIDENRCMGCRSCITACPYVVRYFLNKPQSYYPKHATPYEKAEHARHEVGTVEKCNFCLERVKQGLLPACVECCPAEARHFGDLEDPDSEVAKLIREKKTFVLSPDLGTEPSTYYIPED